MQKQDGMLITSSYTAQSLSFAIDDSLGEKACKQIPSSDMFVSYWLEFLIHIHSSPGVLHILNCSLMSEDVSFV